MKLVSFRRAEAQDTRWRAGLLVPDGVVEVFRAVPGAPDTVLGLLDEWDRWQPQLADAGANPLNQTVLPLADVVLGPPLPRPRSVRDFYAFEAHVKTARAKRGLDMVPEWYHFPVFYFSNAAAIIGPEETVLRPRSAGWLDYELEIACVIGREGVDIPVGEAEAYIAGFCILNDWSARDVQREEVKVGLGPAKGKDFATSLGPYLLTPDELEDVRIPGEAGSRWDLAMTARVNGKTYSRGNFRDIHYTFAQMIARASADCRLYPGDVIGSGTVGTGCILELDGVPWLAPGDVVELEVERLGVLRNRIGEKRERKTVEENR